ncbi:uncharacterized protein LOC108666132 [Hyalella azteca]|uniref:Uncharacterized protein LOC108666132 n=1 Tax=Hyalella azteca TaxID=294128 RepID=A0A8B7N598_HYAAZ|nr:uncharacterized protein LOC108666132 [Hyalella azteca]
MTTVDATSGLGVWGAYSGLAHGALGLVYSASFLNAGFIGLGALWLASYLGHGGFGGVIGDDYGDYDYYGGYGDYGGGYGGYKDQKGGYGHRPSYGAPSPYGNRGRIGGSSRHGKNNKRNSEWIRKKRSTDIAEGGYIHGDIRRSKGRKYRRTRNEEEIIVDELKRRDANGCSMRLVCEISAVKFRALRKEEWDILQFVRSGDALFNIAHPGQGVRSSSPVLADYRAAAKFGRTGGACSQRYRNCPYSATEIINFIHVLKR